MNNIEKQIILAHAQPHHCTSSTCGGVQEHHRGTLEIPSATFIKACLITLERRGETPSDNGIAPL